MLLLSVTVRMALFWACQLPMSLLSLKAPRSLSVPGRSGHFGQIAALGGGRACHLHFNIFQGVMSKKKTWTVLGTDSSSTCCSLVMLTILWDQVHLAYSFFQKKQQNKNITIHLPFCFVPLEKGAQLGLVKLFFCLKSPYRRVTRRRVAHQAI